MSEEVLYEIARYSTDSGAEILDERAQIFRDGDQLWYRVGDGAPTPRAQVSVTEVIATDPALHEIHSYDVTRIVAEDDVAQKLPLVLQGTGPWNEQDYEYWSDDLYSEHIYGSSLSNLPYDENCVLYVNDERWSRWRGDVMLPDDGGGIQVLQEWVSVTSMELGNMMESVTDTSELALVTSSVVAFIPLPDPEGMNSPDGFPEVWVLGRDGSAAGDAEIILQWLTDGPIGPSFEEISEMGVEPISDALLVELFVEVAVNGRSGRFDRLSYAAERTSRFGGSGFADWDLVIIDLSQDVIDATVDLIAQQNSVFQDIVTAARDPRSPAAQARDARVAAAKELGDRDDSGA